MKIWLGVLLIFCFFSSSGQLVRKRDYNAAFALQAGGSTGILVFSEASKVNVASTFGLKMTFPFTRKWFFGSEVVYTPLKYNGECDLSGFSFEAGRLYNGKMEIRADLKSIQLPVYLKYRLNSNKDDLLFGVYASWIFDAGFYSLATDGKVYDPADLPGATDLADIRLFDLSREVNTWDGGITVGYERRLMKHLNLMFRVSAGLKDLLVKDNTFGGNLYPLRASLTLSFDIFRIGDCECD